ncbi:MAG: type III polyketide synthase [Planctomycetota bacterium]
MDAWITHLGHALPGPPLPQAAITAWIERRLAPGADPERLRRISDRSGVAVRHATIDLLGAEGDALYPVGAAHADAYQRSRAFTQHAPTLAVAAVHAACPDGLPTITHLIVATCTGAVAPGLDHLLVEALALPRSVRRTMITFMGCYAAMPALRAARNAVLANPGTRALVVCCELSSLHLHAGPDDDALVAACLFADGAAAAVVEASDTPHGARLRFSRDVCAVIPDSADQMAWSAAADGFRLRLAPGISRVLAPALPGLTDELLGGIRRDDVRWCVHPGGPRILDDIEHVLKLSTDALAASRSALRQGGNRSSATVLAMLADQCQQPWSGPLAMYAFGPGLTAEGLLLERIT